MKADGGIGRRALLAAAAVLPFGAAAGAKAAMRAATLDWAVLETLLALGHPPVAATELVQFREVAVEPPMPDSVADLGLRGLPNLETLLFARPDIIFNSNFYVALEPRLAAIAPVESFTLYRPGHSPYDPVIAMTRRVAERLGIGDAADALVGRTDAGFAQARRRLEGLGRPVLPINLGDARHFRVFGFDSMIGETLQRIGLQNAWAEATSYSAAAPLGLETLARHGEAWIAVIGPVPPDATPVLRRSAFWQALPAVKAGRVVWLDPIDPFGALPSARRFARLLTEALVEARGRG
ncbi:iron-siderophore ABC transporter substrate-binding protein [Ancylobacter defluvii]|uniref:Amino acid ABC transporter substrate-binding protein n=1 Tax=Ancylobacter defluvii TaxID=1282440 RepID=A0A9W6JV10_9HYPH|nr:iron-siderophore ABC transporter substrate-binding protein [Ancylobacter defluvii]MBS7590008.1 iron-siderophore ABC transporter substrate-binding protein [Ancylobacter defluvii]GLK83136.1 amino acid ABC transporter substrate-binding protein [Ancylobacter defluvii]